MSVEKETILRYNRDLQEMEGYIYTGTNSSLSMHLFNKRVFMALYRLIKTRCQSLLDVGCGDGTFTVELAEYLGVSEAVGVEPSEGWQLAQKKFADQYPRISFRQGSAYRLPYPLGHFDLAVMRGVLHHLDQPVQGLGEMARVARYVLLLEPNGYNPLLKLIEKLSPYHRAHNEKSFSPAQIRYWLNKVGCQVMEDSFASLVPLFCPDRAAQFLDWLSPKWESLPLLNKLSCGLFCVMARSTSSVA